MEQVDNDNQANPADGSQALPPGGNRRKISGLVVDKQSQFKMAIACLSLIMLPSLITSITLLADLALEAGRLADTAIPANEIAQLLAARALNYGFIIVAVFCIFAGVSIMLSLRLSNHVIGPVARLETHVRDMIDGTYEERRELRKGDYLKNLGELLNELAVRLRSKNG